MATNLNWEDLFSQDSGIDFARIFSCWPAIGGKVLPIGLSAFGDTFFARADETIWRLDAFFGKVEQVARSQAEFEESMNTLSWQEEFLRSKLVFELKQRGLTRGPRQVFVPVPHPAFTGEPVLEKAQVMDAVVWHGISSQSLVTAAGQSEAWPAAAKPWWRFW